MSSHSSILAWRIPWAEEPGRLQSIESPKFGHNRAGTQHIVLSPHPKTSFNLNYFLEGPVPPVQCLLGLGLQHLYFLRTIQSVTEQMVNTKISKTV